MIDDNKSYIQINDIKLHYYDNANIGMPSLIFLHGLGENLDSWMSQLNYFDANYRVITLDLRGHGNTGDGQYKITIEQFAKDVVELLSILNIDKAHFVGLSMGGMICQELTKHYQAHMLSLALCNTAAYAVSSNLSEQTKWIQAVEFDTLAKVTANLCLPKGYNEELYKNVVEMFRHNRKPPYLEATIAAFTIDFRDILVNINVPTLVITGALDIVTPVEMAKYMHNNIANSELVLIPGAGHLSNLEQPDFFNKALAEFLNKFNY